MNGLTMAGLGLTTGAGRDGKVRTTGGRAGEGGAAKVIVMAPSANNPKVLNATLRIMFGSCLAEVVCRSRVCRSPGCRRAMVPFTSLAGLHRSQPVNAARAQALVNAIHETGKSRFNVRLRREVEILWEPAVPRDQAWKRLRTLLYLQIPSFVTVFADSNHWS
jgi:hypothetical protein